MSARLPSSNLLMRSATTKTDPSLGKSAQDSRRRVQEVSQPCAGAGPRLHGLRSDKLLIPLMALRLRLLLRLRLGLLLGLRARGPLITPVRSSH